MTLLLHTDRVTALPPFRPAALDPDEVVIFPPDPAWPIRFRIEAQLMRVVLADLDPTIEHIGSTAVTALAAKPIIDMMVGVPSLERFASGAGRLSNYGYEYIQAYEATLPDRRFFKRVVDGIRTHHVHVVETGGDYWRRYLSFRDRLRASPKLARRYAQLKYQLAMKHRHDRDAYTAGKTDFIASVLALPDDRA